MKTISNVIQSLGFIRHTCLVCWVHPNKHLLIYDVTGFSHLFCETIVQTLFYCNYNRRFSTTICFISGIHLVCIIPEYTNGMYFLLQAFLLMCPTFGIHSFGSAPIVIENQPFLVATNKEHLTFYSLELRCHKLFSLSNFFDIRDSLWMIALYEECTLRSVSHSVWNFSYWLSVTRQSNSMINSMVTKYQRILLICDCRNQWCDAHRCPSVLLQFFWNKSEAVTVDCESISICYQLFI